MGDWKEVVAEWAGGSAFWGRNPAGAEVQIGTLDGKPGVGPMEMLLLGVAGCTGMDIVSILEKKRYQLEKFEVRVRGLRGDVHPKIYTDIEVAYHLWGKDLQPRDVEQAIQLSEEKYCSASAMLRSAARIRSSYELHPVET